MKLRASGEDYPEAVLVPDKKPGAARSVDVAQQLGVSKPSVSRAISLLKGGGFLRVENKNPYLTEAGREVAENIYEKHCFLRLRLMDVGVDEKTAEKEACLPEHILSDESFEKIKKALVPGGKDG